MAKQANLPAVFKWVRYSGHSLGTVTATSDRNFDHRKSIEVRGKHEALSIWIAFGITSQDCIYQCNPIHTINNVNPRLINHDLSIRGYSSSRNLTLPIKQRFGVYSSRLDMIVIFKITDFGATSSMSSGYLQKVM